ncbi:MAG: Signal transduction histidine kinase [Frankiales bacterium]|nr:Signal transduction histidine kinase [Frankiales bacterium]MCW2708550.1 Signal transduction histidine kinase [Frankiales bacterium]
MTRRNVLFDLLVASAVLIPGQLEVWTGAGATHLQGPHWVQALGYGLGALLLLRRRVNPVGVFAGLVAIYVAEFVVVGAPEGYGVAVPPMVAAYSVARWEGRRPAWWGLVLLLLLGLAWITFDPVPATAAARVREAVWWSPWVIAWLLGALVRSRVQNAEQRRLRRQEMATRAVTEERNRIARELHDVIGHSVSIMTVQASAVRRRLNDDQASEREALETVETTGRQALAEMRRMVGVLRQNGEAAEREPAPGLTELPRLVDQFRSAGLPVDVAVTGQARPLAPGLDLTAYRLVQEALTNSLRHAVSPTRAEVSIGYTSEHLELAIRDDGRRVAPGAEAGHGLLGLRERVSVYGGDLIARPRPEGGFELLATMPLAPA